MLAVFPCQNRCDWAVTGSRYGGDPGLPLFRCAGCRSEWVRTERWTPSQADGTVPPAVREELGPGQRG